MNENLKPVEKLTPFTKMIMTIGALPSSFYASMSYYESMVWLYEYLKNNVIPAVNNNGEAVEELQEKYIELKSYIDNYFENLDVQEEINKKLDEMAEDGSLTNLIKGYIDPIFENYTTQVNNTIGEQNQRITNIENSNSAFQTSVNNSISTIDTKVNNATSGSPLVANSTSEMTDTTRVYVNTTDGKWYYYDGDSWEIGGTYQASEDSGSVNYLLQYGIVKTSKDLLNYDNITEGYFISDNAGTLSSSPSYNTSDYMYLEAGTSYTIKGFIRKFLAYNLDKQAIASSYQTDSQTDYVYTPENNCYIRISFLTTSEIQVVKTSDLSDSIWRGYIEIFKDKVLLNDYQLNQIDNKYYLTKMANNFTKNYNDITLTWIPDSYMKTNLTLDTSINAKYTSYSITNDNINNVYRIKGKSHSGVKPFIFAYGDNRVYQPNQSSVDTEIDVLFIPHTTGTLYLNEYTLRDYHTELKVLDSLTLNIENNNILSNKKYVALGDSFTHGDFTNAPEDNYHIEEGIYQGEYKVYPYLIGNRNNMNVINLAQNGMTCTNINGTSENYISDTILANIPADTDYITIKIGINDDSVHQNAPLGTIDSNDSTTFYGSFNRIMNYLINNHKEAKIGIIVSNGVSDTAIVNATINIAKKYGIAYLNETTDDKVPLLIRTLRTDVSSEIKNLRNYNWYVNIIEGSSNHHPNAKCHEYESTIVENFLRSL